MNWNCALTEERLSDYLEGQLSAAESAAFAAHRSHCERCAQLVGQVSDLLADMHRLEPVEEPPRLQARILDATLGPQAKNEGWRRWFAWTPMIWRPRFAIGLATVAACALIVIQAGGVLPTRMHKANVNPADIVRSINRQAHLTYAQGVRFVNNLRVVYEIESRLDSQNPQQPAGGPGRSNLPPNQNNPQEKSDKRGRSQSQEAIVYADGDSENAPSEARARSEISSVNTFVPHDANQSQQRFETHLDRRHAPRNLFAGARSGDPNLNQGFSAADRSAVAAAGQAKPEWSAP
jgi:hypothetical protein